ncbi:flavodoxin domain-containing protein [Bullifex porci]|uniref:flavodoxin domain-containing protein n=1 Tax=Bullifex porci TaxID=2606638 RepID=UPI0023F451EC|nr:flavodoxin domain-containing protein [Bullifex porci]MDD7256463.1 flavodoxin domain-containing protein [Bullifex porci]MDY2742065.1 flavodoxin domain-containing protein [Bullifex porci]
MDAIVYVSKQGSTERYAKLLAEKLSLNAYKLKDAISILKQGSKIIYLACVRADSIMDLKKAEKYFALKIICAVGMSKTGEGVERIRKANEIDATIPLFTLQGAFYLTELKGIDKLIMKLMKNVLTKQITDKGTLNDDDRDMLKLLNEGGDRVDSYNLNDILKYIKDNRI